MKNPKGFLTQRETAHFTGERLKVFVQAYRIYHESKNSPLKILDIGCGKDVELFEYKINGDKYYGCDFYDQLNIKLDGYQRVDLNEESLFDKFPGQKFDVVFCGEVIEHLFSPDVLLEEVKNLMHEESILILSTPNLAYYVNRVLLLIGISPLFLENSSEQKLGRRFSFLGQNNPTEGHIRLFTYEALRDLLKIKDFQILEEITIPGYWDFFLDRFFARLSKSLAAANVFVVRKAATNK